MIPPLLRLFLNEPGLLVSHASAYGTLIQEDVARWQAGQTRRLFALCVAACLAFLAVLFGGMALMLYATSGSTHWLLWAVPVATLSLSIGVALYYRTLTPGAVFPRVRQQLAEDTELFGLKDPHQ